MTESDRFAGIQSSENIYNYQVRRKKLTEQILKQDSTSTRTQVDQSENPMRVCKMHFQ